MTWIVLIEVIVTAIFFGLTWWLERKGARASTDTIVVLFGAGILGSAVTILTLIGWGAYKLVY